MNRLPAFYCFTDPSQATAAMAFSFAVPDAAAENLLRLVGSYAGLDRELTISVGGVAEVEFTADGTQASGAHTACRYICSKSPSAEQLLGQDAEQQAKVGLGDADGALPGGALAAGAGSRHWRQRALPAAASRPVAPASSALHSSPLSLWLPYTRRLRSG